jgi:hypothetical protein
MALTTTVIDELNSDLSTVKRINRKYGDKYNEPGTVGRLMWLMVQDPGHTKHNKDGTTTSLGDFRKLEDIYQKHFGNHEDYNVDGCPHCNAIYLNTTVAELIECIGSDLVNYSTKDYEEGDE